MKDTTISFLFKQRKISEKTYFYCFLNKINNISEIDINSIPKTLTCVYNELSEMFTCDDKEQFYNNIKNNIEPLIAIKQVQRYSIKKAVCLI